MYLLLNKRYLVGGGGVVREEWSHGLQVFSLEGLFFDAWPRVLGDYCMGWVEGAEGARQVLLAQETEAIFDWKLLGLRVQVR